MAGRSVFTGHAGEAHGFIARHSAALHADDTSGTPRVKSSNHGHAWAMQGRLKDASCRGCLHEADTQAAIPRSTSRVPCWPAADGRLGFRTPALDAATVGTADCIG